MAEYTDSYVAFLDILGFKDIVNTKSFDEVRDLFVRIITDEEAKMALSRACDEENMELIQYNKSLGK